MSALEKWKRAGIGQNQPVVALESSVSRPIYPAFRRGDHGLVVGVDKPRAMTYRYFITYVFA
jgi:hypothetical protein